MDSVENDASREHDSWVVRPKVDQRMERSESLSLFSISSSNEGGGDGSVGHASIQVQQKIFELLIKNNFGKVYNFSSLTHSCLRAFDLL